ncbi:MAG: SDR family NAD(P)-dependent oxidoreductase [Melioribacter sp.]|uniref:SDR family NAD(P)-dependent oxidoreductase n=1 Tax=Rosettibacter primus TaxID=3111523 RepID=UPI00247DABB8|nr:SDR family NAD(P)-dependent oxidoreductase [Melioribacter sp.]
MEFTGSTILLTGASSGIGKALTEKLSKEKCKLILCARRLDILEKFKEEQNHYAEIFSFKCDVSNKEEVENTYKKIKNDIGNIDLAILNAGVGYRMNIENFNSEYAKETFGVNFFGLVYWIENLIPDFLKRGKGVIAGVSSLADNRGYSKSSFYCASKAAATIFLEGLRVELKPYGIKVITIKPGFVKTPMTDKNEFKMPFLMSAEKAADIILNGIKKEKRIIQFPFPTVISSRLIGCMPSGLYEFLMSHFNEK